MSDPNLKIREDGSILVKNVRLSYAHIFKPYTNDDDKAPKYSVQLMLPKTTHAGAAKAIKAIIDKLAKEELKMSSMPPDRIFLKNGDHKVDKNPEYKGHLIISASESRKPNVVNRDRSPVSEDDDIVYSGCFANVLIRPWAQNHTKYGKRINAGLTMVQFVRDGDRLDGAARPDVEDVFDELDDDGSFDDVGGDDGDDGLGID